MCRQTRQAFRQTSKIFCVVVLMVTCQGWFQVSASWAEVPAVVSATPPNDSTNADPDLSAISFTFSVAMDRGTFAIPQTGSYLILDFVGATWSDDARTLTLPRSGTQGALPEGARVNLILNPQGSSNPFKDQAGNVLPTYTYSFSVAVTDNTPPKIVGTHPPAIEFGDSAVSRDLTEICITFNRAMNERYKSVSTGNWMYSYADIYWSADGKTLHLPRTGTDYGLWPSSEIKFCINLSGYENIQDYLGRFVEATTLSWKVESIDVSDPTEFQKPAANPAKGFYWPYYLYIPRTVGNSAVLLVEPNNTGRPDEDWSVHNQAAGALLNYRSILADELESPLLIPTFPRYDHIYTHALDRSCLLTQEDGLVRIDLQLIAMIDDARQRLAALGIRVGPRVDMMGFSASGSFTGNFTALHPDRIRAAAIGAPGGWPIAPVATWLGHDMIYSLAYPTWKY